MSVNAARASAVLVSLSGLALLAASLLLDWYDFADGPANLWQSLSVVDLFVGASIFCALLAGPAALFAERKGLGVTLATVSANVSLVALVLLAWRAADPPAGSIERGDGVWVGLALQALIVIASFAAMGGGSPPRLSSAR